MARDRWTLPLLVGGGALVLYVAYQGRSAFTRSGASIWTVNPRPAPPGSHIYTRPGQPGAPQTPWGAIASGLSKIFASVVPRGDGIATPGIGGEITPAPIGSDNWPGDLVVFPPDILDGAVMGTTNDPNDPGTYFGSDPILVAAAPALDQGSGFDSQTFSMSFT